MALHKADIVAFIRRNPLAVVSSVSADGAPEAALVNIAVSDELELIFYALQDTRKCVNLRRDPRIAAVIGWKDDTTLQYEGIADEPVDPELEAYKQIYAASRPRAAAQMLWPGLTFFRVRPGWLRLSDYGRPWSVEELTF